MINVTTESLGQTESRGRGGGRGAPFGNSQQRKELRETIGEISCTQRPIII